MSEQSQTPETPQTPSETPQTSKTPPKITRIEKTYKPKDPRRVEAGKRLAAISKSAKEKKARDREAHRADRTCNPTDRYDRAKPSGTESQAQETQPSPTILDWTIPVGGLIVAGLVGLYYAFNKKGADRAKPSGTESQQPKGADTPKESKTQDTTKQRRPQLDSFDD